MRERYFMTHHVAAYGLGGEQDDERFASAQLAVDHFHPVFTDADFFVDEMRDAVVGEVARQFGGQLLVGVDMAVADEYVGHQ
jgi:hypothetical protein